MRQTREMMRSCFAMLLMWPLVLGDAESNDLKREAKDLREIGERAEKRKPPKRPQAKDVSKGDR